MQKFKQRMFLKKVEKLLNTPAPKPENYDSSLDTAYVGATAPRTAGHFADSAVSMTQGQVKRIVELVLGVVEGVEQINVEARLVEVEVKFQELDLRLLFTEQEEAERIAIAAQRRKPQASRVGANGTNVSTAELEAMKSRISQWQTEQLQHKRRLYKIENTVKDLGLNLNDYRCRALDQDRRAALASLTASTDEGVKMLKRVVGELGGFEGATADEFGAGRYCIRGK